MEPQNNPDPMQVDSTTVNDPLVSLTTESPQPVTLPTSAPPQDLSQQPQPDLALPQTPPYPLQSPPHTPVVVAAPMLAGQPYPLQSPPQPVSLGSALSQPMMAPITASPQGGFTPPPFTPINPASKKPTKLIIIITAVIVALVALGGAAFFVLYDRLPLHEVTGQHYSIMVPKSYEKSTDSDGDTYILKGVSRKNPDASINVSCKEIPGLDKLSPTDRSKAMNELKTNTEDALKEGPADSSDKYDISNVQSRLDTSRGDDALDVSVSAKNLTSGRKGEVYVRYLLSKTDICFVQISRVNGDRLAPKTTEIIKSFQTKS